jgi:signal transduction histidine kinase
LSLRTQIILLFTAILVVSMGVAASLGEQAAARAVESVVRERAVQTARSILADVELSPGIDAPRAADRLAAALRQHRGIRSAELFLRKPGKDDVVRMRYGPSGAEASFDQDDYAFPTQTASEITGDGDDRAVRVEVPVKDAFNHTVAALRIDSSLGEAEAVGRGQRMAFLGSTIFAAVLLLGTFGFVLNRRLARPLSELARSVGTVESGPLEEVRIPETGRKDEIGTLARGLQSMLERIRGFNRVLQDRVEEATADLAAKNRELEDLNALLVEARRERQAQERLAALGQLSGTIAHELGNPLNAVSGHVQLLARDRSCPEPVREQVRVIDREVKRMTSIIRRFLDSARALAPRPEPVELRELVEEALSLNVSAEARQRLELVPDVPEDIGVVAIDPSLVRHVLGNFLSNAVDAMPGGGRLSVRARRAGNQIALSVSDTGPGIDAETRKRIFEPFFTTKAPGKGTGLGLAICREIAAALHGHVDVESQPGRGSTFTLVVPAPPLDDTGRAASSAAR